MSGGVEDSLYTNGDERLLHSQLTRGRVLRDVGELTMCADLVTSIALNEGPGGRDVKSI